MHADPSPDDSGTSDPVAWILLSMNKAHSCVPMRKLATLGTSDPVSGILLSMDDKALMRADA